MATDSDAAPPQYDALASVYDLLWRVPAVHPLLPHLTSVVEKLAPASGASVLDLACGTGLGLRLMKRFGASTLVGVDISPQMLEIAKKLDPTLTVYTGDCTKPLDDLGLEPHGYDYVLGIWLLNYCPSSVEMAGMWANIGRYIKPGGKFVGIIENHDVAHPISVRTMKYGGMMSDVQELENGEGWSVHVVFDTQPPIEFDAFRLRGPILEAEAKKAGFGEIFYSKPTWEDVKVSVGEGIGGEDGKDEAWWTELIEHSPNYVIVATKEG
ncbi:hypothetical protein H072_3427 [Dactylellina haptotyla CBS 200.50]|uniref:Methyltransferase domain-containing protein n=1 Tax=Dactylellina haptotyla (strain CBS 200.50) TaxID=1284197 RepID=S8AHV5_DACHA|nr:hypothetical protein H072_3427 [Dactylellina haptotyla CBS 200.50]